MVTIKQINPNSPRLGYEVQKGLIVDMPNGDGKATIEETDGVITISEQNGTHSVTLKNVKVPDLGNPNILIEMRGGVDNNHLNLNDVAFDTQKTTIVSSHSDNSISDTIFRGDNYVYMQKDTITDTFIEDCHLERSSVTNSNIDHSYILATTIDESTVKSSRLYVTEAIDSTVSLTKSSLGTFHNATVAGIIKGPMDDHRILTDGYYVGRAEVKDDIAYNEALALLILTDSLPTEIDKKYYRPSQELIDTIQDKWDTVPDKMKNNVLETTPFLTTIVGDDVSMDDIVQSVYDDEAWRVADEFYIDPNIFLFSDKDELQQ